MMGNNWGPIGGGKGSALDEYEYQRLKKKIHRDGKGQNMKKPEEQYIDDNPKTVYGTAKPPLSAIPPTAIMHLGLVMENGKKKYGHMNWRDKKVSSTIYYDAGMRHFMSWLDGEDRDTESNLHPLAHVMACCAIILDAISTGQLIDDRPTKGKYPQELAYRTLSIAKDSDPREDPRRES